MTQAYAKQRAGRAQRRALHLGEGPGLQLTASERDLVVIIGKSFKPPARGVLAVKAQTSARAQPQGRSVPGRSSPGATPGPGGCCWFAGWFPGAAGCHIPPSWVFKQGGCLWQVESGNGAMLGLGHAGSLLPAAGPSEGGFTAEQGRRERLGVPAREGTRHLRHSQARQGDARVQRGG